MSDWVAMTFKYKFSIFDFFKGNFSIGRDREISEMWKSIKISAVGP